jgi:hypothetical protein
MAERLKAAVLKTVERKFRGFESYSLRHIYHVVYQGVSQIMGSPLIFNLPLGLNKGAAVAKTPDLKSWGFSVTGRCFSTER